MPTFRKYKKTKGFQRFPHHRTESTCYLDKIYLFILFAKNRKMYITFRMLFEINH